jgi:hypothetical protein
MRQQADGLQRVLANQKGRAIIELRVLCNCT